MKLTAGAILSQLWHPNMMGPTHAWSKVYTTRGKLCFHPHIWCHQAAPQDCPGARGADRRIFQCCHGRHTNCRALLWVAAMKFLQNGPATHILFHFDFVGVFEAALCRLIIFIKRCSIFLFLVHYSLHISVGIKNFPMRSDVFAKCCSNILVK